jgi:preprotein translocase subunit YajC
MIIFFLCFIIFFIGVTIYLIHREMKQMQKIRQLEEKTKNLK